MEGSAQFCLLVVLLFVAPDSAEAQKTPSYFKLGGTLTLRPPFSGTITSIVYKFGGNLVAEYADNGVPLTYYSTFRGRTTLNIGTGELEINNMGKDDIGEFVVEINNVVQSQRFEAVEIKDVPDPSVSVKPLVCDSSSSNCSLSCDGEIKESEPVTFSWRKDDGEWKESKQVLKITNDEETKKVKTFSCKMKNPVSEKESKPEKNPFHPESDPKPDPDVGGIVAGILIPVLIIIGGGLGYWQRDKIRLLLNRSGDSKPKETGDPEASKPNSPVNTNREKIPLNPTGNAEAAKSGE
ncbi:uncharacterized protein LOC125018607 [Mugil cephalus]|uniref:uncharacterized protein LOC125018607 n=1 Tax=Mugil cephalus TaxID=48193 RepID=UPI001FB737AC|nr:uncharacterized protein LOC125018607 [Mugil cephalus]